MNQTTAEVLALRVAPGEGRLVRRDDALLFVPGTAGETTSGTALADAFLAAEPGQALRALGSATVAADFAVPAYVASAWGGEVTVMAFGDVTVTTDQPALPLLTAGASPTWVEHTLFEVAERLVIETTPPEARDTDLVAGQVPAGGFRLELAMNESVVADQQLAIEAQPEPTVGQVPDAEAQPHIVTVDQVAPITSVASLDSPDLSAAPSSPIPSRDVSPSPGQSAPGQSAPASAQSRSDYTLPPHGIRDPAQLLSAIQQAAVGTDGSPATPVAPPVAQPPPPSAASVGLESQLNSREPAPLLSSDPVSSSVDPIEAVLVDGRRCELGHGSPPHLAACQVCGAILNPALSPIEQVARPVLGDLVLDDGTRFPLDRTYCIGRRPKEAGDRVAVKIDGDKVSRQHASILVEEWSIFACDLASTNGTYLLATPGSELTKLGSAPTQVSVGSVLYVGSRTFTIEPNSHNL